MIKLFEIENAEVKPSEHCYIIKDLKAIMDNYPSDYLAIYAYLFYMSSYNEDLNPFANVPEAEKEDTVLEQVGGDFSSDEELVVKALETCKKLYETPSLNMYLSIKIALENLGRYLRSTPVSDGRDGNIGDVIKTAEKYDTICRSFEARHKAFKEENSTRARGGARIAYDQIDE